MFFGLYTAKFLYIVQCFKMYCLAPQTKAFMNVKQGKTFFPLTKRGKNDDFNNHENPQKSENPPPAMIAKVTIFFPICQREKLFSPLQVHKGLYLSSHDICFTAQRNFSKFEGVGCQKPRENVTLAIRSLKSPFFPPSSEGKTFFPTLSS